MDETERNLDNKISRGDSRSVLVPMPNRYRRSYLAAGRIITVVAVLLTGERGIAFYGYCNGQSCEALAFAAVEKQSNTGPYAADCEKPQDHDAADFCQQRRMADASEDLVAWGKRQFFATLGEVLLLIATVGAAIWAAIQATRAANVSEKALLSVERAFVFVKYAYAVPILGKPSRPGQKRPLKAWRFHIVWENSGSTPTQHMTTYKNITGFEGSEMSDNFDFPDRVAAGSIKETPLTFIGPRAIKDAGGLDIPVDVLRNTFKGGGHVYMWGWAEYSDIFRPNERSRSEFCFEIIPDGDIRRAPDKDAPAPFIFRAYKKHNGSGGECFRQPGDPIPVMEI